MTTSYQFTTYGILVRDDRARQLDIVDPLVAIAAEVGEDGRWRGVTFIPAGMVTDVFDLGNPKRKRLPKKKVLHDPLPPVLPVSNSD